MPFRSRLIGTAFARRGPPVRVSPVPHQSFAACPLPYPGGVRRASSLPRAVCCLRRDMTGSTTPPFGSYVTGLQRFTLVGPAALLPLDEAYTPSSAFDAPLRRQDLSRRPEPATRRTGLLTATGLAPAGMGRHRDRLPKGRAASFRTHHAGHSNASSAPQKAASSNNPAVACGARRHAGTVPAPMTRAPPPMRSRLLGALPGAR